MYKTITTRPQSNSKQVFKKALRPVAKFALTAIELLEKIDAQFFTEEDTWRMRVVFYGFYFVGVPFILFWISYMFL